MGQMVGAFIAVTALFSVILYTLETYQVTMGRVVGLVPVTSRDRCAEVNIHISFTAGMQWRRADAPRPDPFYLAP